jgi:hypothetical protein
MFGKWHGAVMGILGLLVEKDSYAWGFLDPQRDRIRGVGREYSASDPFWGVAEPLKSSASPRLSFRSSLLGLRNGMAGDPTDGWYAEALGAKSPDITYLLT